MTGRLVAVVGIDGSGKTTAAKNAVRRLRNDGARARYFENPGLRPPLNWIARRRGHEDAIGWLGIEAFQAIEHRVRKVAMWRAVLWSCLPGERVAVMDRYTVCQYAAIRARSGPGEAAVRESYEALPWPDAVVYLDVLPLEAQQRVDRRGRDSETLEHLTAGVEAYRSLPEWPAFIVVDASAPVEVVASTLVGIIRP